ncbi:MAG: hypothetical protein ACI97A_002786 [Planctomycetota bacterium]|jgi:uncharacterized protein (DUF1501 family)
MKRRELLKVGLGTIGSTLLVPSALGARIFSAPLADATKRTIVAIYLRGGADALNMIVPYGDKFYRQLRPQIAITADAEKENERLIKLNKMFGFHPALAALKPFYDKGMMAPIVCVGSNHPTRSHFDAQDFMEYAAPGSRSVKDGWLNRYLAAVEVQNKTGLRGVALQKKLPRSLRGSYPVLAVPAGKSGKLIKVLDEFDDLYGGDMDGKRTKDGAEQVGRDTISRLRRFHSIVEGSSIAPSTVTYPKGRYAQGLSQIARLIKANAGLETACLDVGGWDTHTNQGGATGNYANRLKGIADGISAFARDLGDKRMKDVCVMVMTEFGRTCRENGNQGTDHGHGSAMLMLSGSLNGGRVVGDWAGLDPKKQLYQGRDLQVTTDFRQVFHDTLKDYMGFDVPSSFFPDYSPPKSRSKALKLFK